MTKKSDGGKALLIGGSALAIGLVVLLAAVCLIGIVAAIAIPSFVGYVRRSKTSEATSQLRAMFTGAAAYYSQEHSGPGGLASGCTVGPATTPNEPGHALVPMPRPVPASFEEIGMPFADPGYYQYEIVASPSRCGHEANEPSIYTFRAHGDLDGDGVRSLFELVAGSDGDNRLYRAPDVYVENEVE